MANKPADHSELSDFLKEVEGIVAIITGSHPLTGDSVIVGILPEASMLYGQNQRVLVVCCLLMQGCERILPPTPEQAAAQRERDRRAAGYRLRIPEGRWGVEAVYYRGCEWQVPTESGMVLLDQATRTYGLVQPHLSDEMPDAFTVQNLTPEVVWNQRVWCHPDFIHLEVNGYPIAPRFSLSPDGLWCDIRPPGRNSCSPM